MTLHYAYCRRDGRVHVGRCVPTGALPLVTGSDGHLARVVRALAANAWRRGHFRVPGLATAQTDDEALAAVARFRGQLEQYAIPCGTA